jgi:hypothetical protein
MSTIAPVEEDDRTLAAYLRDVQRLEAEGHYLEHSRLRKKILNYWNDALSAGVVSLDDPMTVALEKVKQKYRPLMRNVF